MQYWLIDYGNTCPSGWNAVQRQLLQEQRRGDGAQAADHRRSPQLKLSGTAVSGGNDTLVFTKPAPTPTAPPARTASPYLATAWKQAEFNIIGDGGGSKATFNKGSSITVKVAVTHGSTAAPSCASNAGTTGETNNLTLGSCSAVSRLDAVHPVQGIELRFVAPSR